MKNVAKKIILAVLLISGGASFAQTVQADLSSTTQVEAKSSKDKGVRTYDGFRFGS